jgi:hypothetical protein
MTQHTTMFLDFSDTKIIGQINFFVLQNTVCGFLLRPYKNVLRQYSIQFLLLYYNSPADYDRTQELKTYLRAR